MRKKLITLASLFTISFIAAGHYLPIAGLALLFGIMLVMTVLYK